MPEPIAVLVATSNREALLRSCSLPSVFGQTVAPTRVVVVNDGVPLSEETEREVGRLANAAAVPLAWLANVRERGAAGAWNTGLGHLWTTGHRGFVALLDDDDAWDPNHLEVNAAHASGANIVVSGLRMCAGGVVEPRPLVERLRDRDFLVGNPGWQGSNTFVALPLLMAVGGFRDGLASMNDRDLAIRLLRHPSASWRLAPQWTATWNRDTPGNLSSPGSEAKLLGLRRFWRAYGAEMTPDERNAYVARAERLFGFGLSDIDVGAASGGAEPAFGSLHEQTR